MRSITGMMINYYFICRRKLWLFANYIELEEGNENVLIGKVIDSQRFGREKHNIPVGDVMNADFIKEGRIVHEIKKSDSCHEASRWQVLFYLSELEKLGIGPTVGVLHYDEQHKSTEVTLTDENRKRLREVLNDIENEISMPSPPAAKKRPLCKKCAYYDFCMV